MQGTIDYSEFKALMYKLFEKDEKITSKKKVLSVIKEEEKD